MRFHTRANTGPADYTAGEPLHCKQSKERSLPAPSFRLRLCEPPKSHTQTAPERRAAIGDCDCSCCAITPAPGGTCGLCAAVCTHGQGPKAAPETLRLSGKPLQLSPTQFPEGISGIGGHLASLPRSPAASLVCHHTRPLKTRCADGGSLQATADPVRVTLCLSGDLRVVPLQ